jgi:hypothetical protein
MQEQIRVTKNIMLMYIKRMFIHIENFQCITKNRIYK